MRRKRDRKTYSKKSNLIQAVREVRNHQRMYLSKRWKRLRWFNQLKR